MKRAISVRKAALMIATVWNTSAPDKGFMSCLASCEAPGVNHLGWKMFRFQTQVGEDASGVSVRGGQRVRPCPLCSRQRDQIQSISGRDRSLRIDGTAADIIQSPEL